MLSANVRIAAFFLVALLMASTADTGRRQAVPVDRAQSVLAPGGTLRAAFIAGNPAQATTDAGTGERRGVAVDLARELARRLGVQVVLNGRPNPQGVMEAVQKGEADIGFVAYNPERAGLVGFSRPYVLVQQTFLVPGGSSIRGVADIDRSNQRIGATARDSIALYLARTLKQARLVELTNASPADVTRMLTSGELDAFGANRQRLTDVLGGTTGLRLLPDDLYGVEQTVVVANGRSDALAIVNAFLDDVRRSGFLRAAIDRSGVVGISPAQEN